MFFVFVFFLAIPLPFSLFPLSPSFEPFPLVFVIVPFPPFTFTPGPVSFDFPWGIVVSWSSVLGTICTFFLGSRFRVVVFLTGQITNQNRNEHTNDGNREQPDRELGHLCDSWGSDVDRLGLGKL